jgi:hypothetical protein
MIQPIKDRVHPVREKSVDVRRRRGLELGGDPRLDAHTGTQDEHLERETEFGAARNEQLFCCCSQPNM